MEINVIIEELCRKLDCTAAELTTKYAEYAITKDIYSIIFCIISIIVGGISIYIGHKKLKIDDLNGIGWVSTTCGAILLIGGIMFLVAVGYDMYLWHIEPAMRMIDIITQ